MNEENPQSKIPQDTGTRLAHERTDLAMDRNYMASERTLMAWVRTSLSMISFGFTIGKLGKVLENIQFRGPLGNIRTVSIESLAYYLVILGTVALLGATIQHWRRVRELRAMGLPYRFSITIVVALSLAALGGFALTSLVLQL
jgi:putative membrane protein